VPEPVTRDEWHALFKSIISRMVLRERIPFFRARKLAYKETEVRLGPEPASPVKPPLPIRILVALLGKHLQGMKPLEVPMFAQKLIVSLVFGIGAAGPVVSAAFADGVISGQEWGGILSAFIAAAYGKFSSNTTVFAPARKGETVTDFGPKD